MTRDFLAMSDPDLNPQFRRFADGPIRFRGETGVKNISSWALVHAHDGGGTDAGRISRSGPIQDLTFRAAAGSSR